MPFLMNTRERVEMMTDAVIHLVETGGPAALTVRRIADVMRLSPSTLTSHLTDKHRMMDLATKRVGDRLVREMERGARWHGIYGFVPDEEQLRLVRAWLAMTELARADEELRAATVEATQQLRDVLASAARVHPGDALTLDVLLAIVVGLWFAQCDPLEPIPAARARAVLRYACAALDLDGEPEAA